MEIDINKPRTAIGKVYKIFEAQVHRYSATPELVNWLSIIHLREKEPNRECLQIRELKSWFTSRYNIHRSNGEVLEFRFKSFWLLEYECRSRQDDYQIFAHRGTKYSVYKNGIQIAWWHKAEVDWFDGENYRLTANNNCDIELVLAFCLLIDNLASVDFDGNTVTKDWGYMGLQAKKFDEEWRPNC